MPESNLRRPIIVSAVLLAAYAAIVAWSFYEQATSWPHEGSWASVAFIFLCPGIVFQAFNLAFMHLKGRLLARRMLTRLATIPLGLALAVVLGQSASALSMRGFVEAYAPLVAKVGANPASACGQDPKHFEIPATAVYNRGAGRMQPTGKLKHGDKRFVLAFAGGSMDIDGSTLYYDSGARTWSKFHNDDREKAASLAKLTEGLAECALRAP
jgi:hypothetical protein